MKERCEMMKKMMVFMVMFFFFCGCSFYTKEDTKLFSYTLNNDEDIHNSFSPVEEDFYVEEYLPIPQNPVAGWKDSSCTKDYSMDSNLYSTVLLQPNYEKELTLLLPYNTVFEGEGDYLKAFFTAEDYLCLGWIFHYEIKEYPTQHDRIYQYRDPTKTPGYISHERVVCGDYECVRIYSNTAAYGEQIETFTWCEYFVCVNEYELLWLSFGIEDVNNIESKINHEKIIANINY